MSDEHFSLSPRPLETLAFRRFLVETSERKHLDNHEELYDIRNDPTEMINAFEDTGSVETAEKTRKMLRRWSLDASDIARNRQYEIDGRRGKN